MAVLMVCVMAVSSFTACKSSKTNEAKTVKLDPDNLVTIKIWHYYNGTQQATFDKLLEKFNSTVGKAAEESIVLLKNEDQILPLKPKTKVAVIGDFAKTPRYQGAGSSLVNSAKQPEAILDVIGSTDLDVVAYEQGYIRNRKPNQKLTKAAVELAKKFGQEGSSGFVNGILAKFA